MSKNTRPLRRLAGLLTVLCLLTSCGFHLRGSYNLPPVMAHTYIEFSGALDFELREEIGNALRSSNINVVERKDDATAVITISKQRLERRTLAVNTQGQVQQYQLRYFIVYSLAENRGATLFPATEIEYVREYTFDDNDILGKRGEETYLQRDMMRDAAQQIVRSLQSIGH